MPYLRGQVRLARDTGLEADVITNTWYFDVDNGTAAAAAAEAHTGLEFFYQAVDVYLSADQITNTAEVRWYDLEDSEPRFPIYEDTIALTPTASNPLLPEASICLSFQGAEESGVNMRRRRGRVFLGPLVTTTGGLSGGRLAVSSAVRDAIAAAAAGLKAYTGTLGVSWAVFSPTTFAETSSLDQAMEDVVSGWVDNEYDIQRRRGTIATARSTFS